MGKKIFIMLFIIILIGITFFYIKDSLFSPLKEKDFQKMFNSYHKLPEKICDIDLLGPSTRSEFFEFYMYQTNESVIDSTYPLFKNEWESKQFPADAIIRKWKNCPIDSLTWHLYEFSLTTNNLNEKDCSNSFNAELRNSRNYYSFIYFNELEQYFLLYCPDKENLYYIRKKGF